MSVRRKFVKRLNNEWEVYISMKYPDKYFYYNSRTGETTWEAPEPFENEQLTKEKDAKDSQSDEDCWAEDGIYEDKCRRNTKSPDKPYDSKSVRVSNDLHSPTQPENGPNVPKCVNCAAKDHYQTKCSVSETGICNSGSLSSSHHTTQKSCNTTRKKSTCEAEKTETQGNGRIKLKRSWLETESSAVSYEDKRLNTQNNTPNNGKYTMKRVSDKDEPVGVPSKSMKLSTTTNEVDCGKRKFPVAGIAERRMIRLKKKLELERNLLLKKNRNSSPPPPPPPPVAAAAATNTTTNTAPNKRGPTSEKNVAAHQLKVSQNTLNKEPNKATPCKKVSNELSSKSVCIVQDSKGVADDSEFLEAEEKMLMDVQELREEIHKAGGVNPEEIEEMICETIPSTFPNTKSNLYIVIDTNVLVSNFQSIEKLCDTNVEGIGCPVFIIPWMVLHELDILKDRRDVTKSKLTAVRAQKAIKYLHGCFSAKHPRVIGQTLSEAGPNALSSLCNPDNSILECCIQQGKLGRRVLLLSDDKNLQNKCMVNGIDAVGKSDLKKYLNSLNKPSTLSVEKETGSDSVITSFEDSKMRIETLLQNLRHCAKEVLSKVVTHEMKIAYGNRWLDIICVKPPFTLLKDVFKCLTQHWFAVFGLVMSKNSLTTLKELKNICEFHSKNYKGPDVSLQDIKNITIRFARIITEMTKPDYQKMIGEAELYLEDIITACENPFSPCELKVGLSFSEPTSEWLVSKHIVLVNQVRRIWSGCVELCQQLRTVMARDQSSLDVIPTAMLHEEQLKTWVAYFYEPVMNLHSAMERFADFKKDDSTNILEMNSLIDHIYKDFCELYRLISSGDQITFSIVDLYRFCEDCDTGDIFKEIRDQFYNFGVIMKQAIDYFSQKDCLPFTNNNVNSNNILPNDVEMEESY